MIANSRVVAVIPARGGSKGLPGKNLRSVAGRTLLEWTVRAAQGSSYVDQIVVSTDDAEIADAARALGADVPFLRPPDLATDSASSLSVVRHACEQVPGFDLVTLLQPTSPLRTAVDIDATIEACALHGHRRAATVVQEDHGLGVFRHLDIKGHLVELEGIGHVPRRQDSRALFRVNGAVYVTTVGDVLAGQPLLDRATYGVRMPWRRSVDIDSEDDIALATWLMQS